MNPSAQFYLFEKENKIEIRLITPEEAAAAWERGEHWLDTPQKTRSAAKRVTVYPTPTAHGDH
jgi:hypothetical protein